MSSGENANRRRADVPPVSAGPRSPAGGAEGFPYLACLDTIEPSELASAPVTYMDGRNNSWFSAPAEVRHL
jgi:hypothetical protein